MIVSGSFVEALLLIFESVDLEIYRFWEMLKTRNHCVKLVPKRNNKDLMSPEFTRAEIYLQKGGGSSIPLIYR